MLLTLVLSLSMFVLAAVSANGVILALYSSDDVGACLWLVTTVLAMVAVYQCSRTVLPPRPTRAAAKKVQVG
jgi:hypothetical protein